MTFGEIELEIERLMESSIDAETGEIIALDEAEFMSKLDALYTERDDKIDKMVGAYKYYSTLADGIKAEKINLSKRQQIAESKAENIKTFLGHLLNGEKVEKPQYKIGWRKSVKAVCEVDVKDLAPIYRKEKIEPDMTSIKSALKEGATIPGCRLVEANNIQIK